MRQFGRQADLRRRAAGRLAGVLTGLVIAFALTAPPALAANVTTTKAGAVSVEFAFQDALFINAVSVAAPVSRSLFDTRASRIGTRVELGTFNAATTFRFSLQATTGSGTFTWSSDPALNSDGRDHMRVTELYDGDPTLDDRVYKLEWEDNVNLGDGDFNDAVAILRISGDTDGDGLYDDWERFGIDANDDGDTTDAGERELVNGIDQNADGDTTDPGERADPRHKDVFLEMDWMACAVAGGDCAAGDTHSHRPQVASVDRVIQAFRAAPVSNPDGANGIALHVDVSNGVAHRNVLNFNGGPLGCSSTAAGTGAGDFDTVKGANFANAAVRRFAFHYALSIHVENQAGLTNANQRFSGCGELPGNDFYISFGLWGAGIPTVQQESGTIMHELGHNLGLRHGGNENANNKPLYLSTMNYLFQLPGIPTSNRIDYSAQVLPALNESALNEAVGIQDGTDSTLFFCPGATATTQAAGSGAIDWNCNGSFGTSTSPVSVDINGSGALSTLTGFNDWPAVVANLPFQTTGDFQDGQHLDVPPEELDLTTARETRVLTPGPALAAVQAQTVVYGHASTPYTLSASDADSRCDQLTFSATALPTGLSITNNGDCTATLSGTPTGPVGLYPVSYRVADEAGNTDSALSTIRVIWAFSGFFPPIDNPPEVNVVRAGSSVPVKFSLDGDQGRAILAANSPRSERIDCSSGASLGDVVPTDTPGGSGLSYSPGADQYSYVWKTHGRWSGTCRRLTVELVDGTKHSADFRFR